VLKKQCVRFDFFLKEMTQAVTRTKRLLLPDVLLAYQNTLFGKCFGVVL
jgi:hypothetical protein